VKQGHSRVVSLQRQDKVVSFQETRLFHSKETKVYDKFFPRELYLYQRENPRIIETSFIGSFTEAYSKKITKKTKSPKKADIAAFFDNFAARD